LNSKEWQKLRKSANPSKHLGLGDHPRVWGPGGGEKAIVWRKKRVNKSKGSRGGNGRTKTGKGGGKQPQTVTERKPKNHSTTYGERSTREKERAPRLTGRVKKRKTERRPKIKRAGRVPPWKKAVKNFHTKPTPSLQCRWKYTGGQRKI